MCYSDYKAYIEFVRRLNSNLPLNSSLDLLNTFARECEQKIRIEKLSQ